NNLATGCTDFGILIDQSYPDTLGTPGNGVTISDITFVSPDSNIATETGADQVAVNCGVGSCTGTPIFSLYYPREFYVHRGTWNWAGLKTSGGKAPSLTLTVSRILNSQRDLLGVILIFPLEMLSTYYDWFTVRKAREDFKRSSSKSTHLEDQ
ncbi:hypothetical protein H0H92_005302, partial [Tricholoma furcatifolium]